MLFFSQIIKKKKLYFFKSKERKRGGLNIFLLVTRNFWWLSYFIRFVKLLVTYINELWNFLHWKLVKKDHLCAAGEGAELAERDDEVVEDVAHPVVSGDHGTLAEAIHGLLHNHRIWTLVEDERESGHRRAPDQREEIVVEQAIGSVDEFTLLYTASASKQNLMMKQTYKQ